MNSLPVIVRELRAEARNPATFTLRLVAAALLIGLLAGLWFFQMAPHKQGDLFFQSLHLALNAAIWVLVPMMTADCISRERRESTLGLLFLTPLGALDIVVAKSLVHSLRALLLWLAGLPVLTIPLLMGGVSATMVACSVLVNFAALCWALAAGLLASSFCRQRMQALGFAVAFAAAFFLVATMAAGFSLTTASGPIFGDYWVNVMTRGLFLDATLGTWLVPQQRMGFAAVNPATAGLNLLLVEICAKPALLALAALAGTMLVAARAIRLNWQEKPPSPRYLWFLRVFCEPLVLRAFFRRWIRRKLERNPLGWLEQRTWVGRTAVGAWVAVVASFYIAMLGDLVLYRRVITEMQCVAGFGLALALAVVAAGSFRRERELGVMELLLITPQTEREIALGRLKGIWEQFAPAMVLLLGVWLWISFSFGTRNDWTLVVFFAATFLNVPITGLEESLKRRALMTALVATLGLALAVPLVIAGAMPLLVGWLMRYDAEKWNFALSGLFGFELLVALLRDATCVLAATWQLGCAWWHWRRLVRRLGARDFPMEVQ